MSSEYKIVDFFSNIKNKLIVQRLSHEQIQELVTKSNTSKLRDLIQNSQDLEIKVEAAHEIIRRIREK